MQGSRNHKKTTLLGWRKTIYIYIDYPVTDLVWLAISFMLNNLQGL